MDILIILFVIYIVLGIIGSRFIKSGKRYSLVLAITAAIAIMGIVTPLNFLYFFIVAYVIWVIAMITTFYKKRQI